MSTNTRPPQSQVAVAAAAVGAGTLTTPVLPYVPKERRRKTAGLPAGKKRRAHMIRTLFAKGELVATELLRGKPLEGFHDACR
jgi:hypothetical protein